MKRLIRCLIAGSAVFLGLLWAGPASAADPRTPLSADPVFLPAEVGDGTGFCSGFDVLVTFPDFNQYIISQSTAPDGTTTVLITGRARATATRLDAAGNPVKSASYNISGPGTLVFNPDGSFSADLKGPNLLFTTAANSFAGVPTLSYTTGRVTFAVAPNGVTTSYSLAGGARQTDVCAVLA